MNSNANGQSEISHKEKGNKHFKAGEYLKAKDYYTKAIQADQEVALAYCNRAQCNLNLGFTYEAIGDCDAALELKPIWAKAHYRRGIAHKRLYKYDSAIENFQKAAEEEPENESIRQEIEQLKKYLDEDPRIDLKVGLKPDVYRSKKPVKFFRLTKDQVKSSCIYEHGQPSM